jgi:20S proteasome alpha/beta subunit
LYSDEDFVDVASLARKSADQHQSLTQNTGIGRILASQVLLLSEKEIWRVDPTGQFFKCSAAVVGRSSRIVEQLLREKISSDWNEKWKPLFRSTGITQSTATKGRIKKPLHVRDRHLFSHLSIEQAFTLANECIWDYVALRTGRDLTSGDPNVLLCGLSIQRNQSHRIPSKVHYYDLCTLKRFL